MRINIRKSRPSDTSSPGPDLPSVTPKEQIKAARIMGLIGVGLIALFLITIAYASYQNSKPIAVKATVISFSEKTTTTGSGSSRSTSTSYSHAFNYTDLGGVQRTATTGEVRRDSHYATGDVVTIWYYSDNLNLVRVHSWFGIWKIQLTLLLFGGALIWYAKVTIKQVRDKIAEERYLPRISPLAFPKNPL